MTPPEPSGKPPLHYAPSTPTNRRQSISRGLILFTLALAIGALVNEGPRLWRRAELMYWQHQCLEYLFPAQQLVLSVQPGDSSLLSTPKITAVIPRPWFALYNLMSRPGMRSDGTVFLHELVSPHGHHRLDGVDLHLIWNHHFVACGARIIKLGSLDSEPQETFMGGSSFDAFLTLVHPTRVFGGVVDPTDPSHFTFAIDDGPVHNEMNGWLLDNDSVRFEFHQNPATQPAPATAASSP